MNTYNLSKLALNPLFLDLLKQENISFEDILTDNETLAQEANLTLIDQELGDFFRNYQKKSWLLILDQLGINDLLPYIQSSFGQAIIISARSGIASLGKKLSPENHYLDNIHNSEFKVFFPRDLETFLQALKNQKNTIIPLTDQEIAENIYSAPYDEENEELQIIDKSLIDQKECLSLMSPEQAELTLIGTGNHFEELVKLSQLLVENPARISLYCIQEWSYLFSEDMKKKLQSTKKIWIILDHEASQSLQESFRLLDKECFLLSPEYLKIKSNFPEYQNEEANFDSKSLLSRIS